MLNVKSWLKSRPTGEHGIITTLFESSYSDLLKFATQSLHFKASILEVFLIRQALDLLQAIIPLRDERQAIASNAHYEKLYIFAITWSIGALLDSDNRAKFEEFVRAIDRFQLMLPPQDINNFTIFDYWVGDQGLFTTIT